jgi:hypothetical protein
LVTTTTDAIELTPAEVLTHERLNFSVEPNGRALGIKDRYTANTVSDDDDVGNSCLLGDTNDAMFRSMLPSSTIHVASQATMVETEPCNTTWLLVTTFVNCVLTIDTEGAVADNTVSVIFPVELLLLLPLPVNMVSESNELEFWEAAAAYPLNREEFVVLNVRGQVSE